MQQQQLMEKYPIFSTQISKAVYQTSDEIIAVLKEKIEAHAIASYIATFEHFAHTQRINGEIAQGIIDAKNIVFCFGEKIPKGEILAIRPRSIGVCEFQEHFTLSFLEAPNEKSTNTMIEWIESL